MDCEPIKILIIPDKFKGTLTARAAAQAIASGWRKARPGDSLVLLPMTDGGDGFGEVIGSLLRARVQTIKTVDAAHRPCLATWWWRPESRTAVIDSARVIGLAMLPPGRFHPFQLDTYGLGAVIRAAEAKGAAQALIGIGGSATNDAGFGLARALGWRFLGRKGKTIDRWIALGTLDQIRAPQRRRWSGAFTVAVDVQNPLLGPHGATRVYGPQKGLVRKDFALAERCLKSLARVVKHDVRQELARAPGAGAAGGLGFGLSVFLGARLEPGFELFSHLAGLERRLRSVDLVITGEGEIDSSTLMGKGVGRVAQRCRQLNIPCIGIAGVVCADSAARGVFTQAHGMTELTNRRQAQTKPAFWLERLAARTAARWS